MSGEGPTKGGHAGQPVVYAVSVQVIAHFVHLTFISCLSQGVYLRNTLSLAFPHSRTIFTHSSLLLMTVVYLSHARAINT